MKKIMFLFFVLISGLILSQDIKSIKKTVAEINITKNYEIKVVPYSYFMDKSMVTDNGIELKGYYKNGQLRKMEHFLGLSAWYISTEYFFDKKDDLIFVYSKKYQTVNENGYLKNPVKLSEARFYFTKGKIINVLQTNDDQDENIDYLKEAETLKKDLKEYK
jgi:hypothetical protein